MFKEKKKILMVNPLFPKDSYWGFDESMRLMKLGWTMPPLGLATLAAMLSEMFPGFFEILPILDMNIESLTRVKLQEADIVAVTGMIVQKDSLRDIIMRAKSLGKKVIVGGPYATSYRDDVLAMGADHLILDEAELTLKPFIEDFLAGSALSIYDGHSVASRSTVTLTKGGKPLLVETPTPRWDLVNVSRYSSMSLQYSRGCPWNCTFCDITNLYGHESRTKTADQVIAELDAIDATGFRGSIFFVDDNFIGNWKKVKDELLPMVIAWQKKHRFPFSFFTEVSFNLADDNMREVRERMIAAGFTDIFCGLESTSQEVLAEMNKGQNKGNIEEKFLTLQKAGFNVMVGLIFGSDSDTIESFNDALELLKKCGVVAVMAGLLTALRNTILYEKLKSEGRLKTESSGSSAYELGFNFETKIPAHILIEHYVRFMKETYTSKNYYDRCRTLQRRRGNFLRTGGINGAWFQATLKIFYRNLFKHPDWACIKFILGTILTSPKDMPDAITWAIKFAHFGPTTEKMVRAYENM